jgi:hypothetical protein
MIGTTRPVEKMAPSGAIFLFDASCVITSARLGNLHHPAALRRTEVIAMGTNASNRRHRRSNIAALLAANSIVQIYSGAIGGDS